MITKLIFSLVCIGLGWVSMSRIESVLSFARWPSNPQQRAFLRFLKVFSAFLAFMWSLSLWTASVAVWVSWPLAWLFALAFPLMVVAGLLLARSLTRRRFR